MKCPKCQTENRQDAKFCLSCGHPLNSNITQVDDGSMRRSPIQVKKYAQGKKPVLACCLNLLVIGLGQIYNGDFLKAVVMFVLAIVLFIPTSGLSYFPMLFWSMFDAYKVAQGRQSLWK